MLLRQRCHELMDSPEIEPGEHRRALNGLARLNALSGAAHAIWREVKTVASKNKQLKVLDIATGAADVPLRVWRIARRQGYNLQIDGCDLSDTALNQARQSSAACGAPSKFFKLDACKENIPSGYDVLMTSLFIHHLDEKDVVNLLQRMGQAAGRLLVIDDLERSAANLNMVKAVSRIFCRSPIVHFDGPASVKQAFTRAELQDLGAQAELNGAQIKEHFPCRMTLVWHKQQ
jgi:ubiquinone/menaquinone biosynthesis C-methylase UbiE